MRASALSLPFFTCLLAAGLGCRSPGVGTTVTIAVDGGTGGGGGGGGGEDAGDARDSGEDAPVVPLSVLLPNEVRYTFSGKTGVDRASLVSGSRLGENISIEVPRYLGPYALDVESAPAARLADYVAVGALGAYARLSFSVKNTGGLSLSVLRKNAQTGAVWAALTTFEPRGPASDHTPLMLPAVPNDDAFHIVSVTFPTSELALARALASPEENAFALEVTAAPSATTPGSEVAVAWAAVDFFAQAPVVLVHGINDTPSNCFSDYATVMTQAGFSPDLHVDFAGLADKPGLNGGTPTFNGSVADDVSRIDARLEQLRADYGTGDVHLIGHSKGGLDLVNYLATRYPARKARGDVRVLSLQTLGAPHAGSVYADINQPLKAWARAHAYSGTLDWPLWGVVVDDTTDDNILDTVTLSGIKEAILLGSGPIDPGLSDLTTASEAVKTDLAWAGDPDVRFATYGFDADFERSRWLGVTGQLTTPPAPGDVTPKYSTDCRGNPIGSTHWTYSCIDEDEVDTFFWGTLTYPPNGTTCEGWNVCGAPLYRPMARGASATVTSGALIGGTRSTIHLVSRAPDEWEGNDLVVALSSARHPHATQNFVRQGAEPRTIAGQLRIKASGGTETFDARCSHTGANHIAILRTSLANMVACTAADTAAWIRESAPVVDTPAATP